MPHITKVVAKCTWTCGTFNSLTLTPKLKILVKWSECDGDASVFQKFSDSTPNTHGMELDVYFRLSPHAAELFDTHKHNDTNECAIVVNSVDDYCQIVKVVRL